jgi:hypothetical protein
MMASASVHIDRLPPFNIGQSADVPNVNRIRFHR